MRLLVVGAGMYVTGRGTPEPGVILMSLAEASARVPIEEVVVCAQGAEGAEDVARCAAQIRRLLRRELPVRYERAQTLLSSCALAQRFDACIVAVPDHVHHGVGVDMLRAGLHCLMVKPLTPTLAQADQLIALQQERRLHCAVDFHKRFDEGNLFVRRLVRDGALGKLSYMTVEYSQRIRLPRDVFVKWCECTNVFQYLGVHYVDLVYFLTGFIPTRALGKGTRGVLSAAGMNTDDSVHALVEWRDPNDPSSTLLAQYAVSWIDPDTSSALSDQRFSLIGARGRVDCDQKNRGVNLTREGAGMEAVNPYFAKVLSTMDGPAFRGYGYRSIERFLLDVADVRAGTVQPDELHERRPTFLDARPATAVTEAINRSLAAGGDWQDVHE
jgi:predicted dehydrogenase